LGTRVRFFQPEVVMHHSAGGTWAKASAVLVVFLAPHFCQAAIDWATFDDPKAFLLTDPLAESIAQLLTAEKAAAIKRLHESLGAKDVEIRRRAALTLGRLGDHAGVPVMAADLATATGHDRDNVLVALRILKDPKAIPALRGALKDPSPYVRGIAAAALGELKAGEAYGDLVALTKDKAVEENKGLNCFPITPADLACYALGALGDPRAVPVLIDLLADNQTRGSARQALEALTKQKLGEDPQAWRKWWEAQHS
jgi:HEAT repeat protein